ncbi:hypothetical protein [uncultured Mucilaginibacter sp.]|uniref:hypothetical protein n=1 Tax=uncultured Mucilaginibacter sp. TaxID=797541 RepID=UPI002636D603|nr:hypothetical protein [uncultured Mucilaginibacter sp.]
MNNTEQNHTDFLFTTPTYLTGAATIFNLSGNFYEYNSCETGEEADRIAIANDFNITGDDLKKSISKITGK